MFVCVRRECLDNPELVRRIKMFEVMGDQLVLVSSGSLEDAHEALEKIGADWDVLHDQEPDGYDILIESFIVHTEAGVTRQAAFYVSEA